MYKHSAPHKPLSMQLDVDPAPNFPLTHQFGVSSPNEGFREANKNGSIDLSTDGLSAKDFLMRTLASLQCETQDQKDLRSVLLGELSSVLEQVETLTKEVHDQRFARLAAEHKAVRKAGRLAEEALRKASDDFVAKDVFAANMIELQRETRQKLQDLHDLEKRGEHLKRFHSDNELAEWKRNYSEHQDLVAASNQMALDAVNERGRAQEALTAAKEEVGRLAASEESAAS